MRIFHGIHCNAWRCYNVLWLTKQKAVDHYDDVIMTMLASQITSLPVVCSIVYSDVNQRKHQSSASLAFVREIHRGPVNFPHKWPVTRKMFPFDDVIMTLPHLQKAVLCYRSYRNTNESGYSIASFICVVQNSGPVNMVKSWYEVSFVNFELYAIHVIIVFHKIPCYYIRACQLS